MFKYSIYQIDGYGRSIGDPLGVVFVEPSDPKDYKDWIFEKRCAIANFVKENPEYAEDKNWLTAIPMPGEL